MVSGLNFTPRFWSVEKIRELVATCKLQETVSKGCLVIPRDIISGSVLYGVRSPNL